MNTERSARNSQELVDRIVRLMEDRRFNPSSFAQALGYTRQWGYQFVENRILISVTLLEQIAKVLDVSVASLLNADNTRQTFEEYVRRIVRDEIVKGKEKG